jgi:Uma2 family endonuclease
MSLTGTSSRPFEAGTTGWTAHDLDDPQIEAQWFAGRYEIVEGVLTQMPPAYFAGGSALYELMKRVENHLVARQIHVRFAPEVDIVVSEARVVHADAAMLTQTDLAMQEAAAKTAPSRPSVRRTRILIPPTLVIESVSPGHEFHDQRTKRGWYAEFGIPHYWVLDAFEQTLECLTLAGGSFKTDAVGKGAEVLHPVWPEGLAISLGALW